MCYIRCTTAIYYVNDFLEITAQKKATGEKGPATRAWDFED